MVPLAKGRFGWNAPLVIDRRTKQRIAATLDTVATACCQAGFPATDERQPAPAAAS